MSPKVFARVYSKNRFTVKIGGGKTIKLTEKRQEEYSETATKHRLFQLQICHNEEGQ